jgi:hypothetical protein
MSWVASVFSSNFGHVWRHHNLDVLVLVLHQFVKTFGDDIVDMDAACDHCFNAFELACNEDQLCQAMKKLLTCYKCFDGLLEVLVIVCQSALHCDFLQKVISERHDHLEAISELHI